MARIAVSLSAYEACGNRLERLARVLLYVLSHKGRTTDATPLKSLHDEKGCLTVGYTSAPSDELKELIEDAWEEEHEYDVEHETVRR